MKYRILHLPTAKYCATRGFRDIFELSSPEKNIYNALLNGGKYRSKFTHYNLDSPIFWFSASEHDDYTLIVIRTKSDNYTEDFVAKDRFGYKKVSEHLYEFEVVEVDD